MRLRFEHAGQQRFWEAVVAGAALTVTAGRLGTPGRVTIDKALPDADAARQHVARIVSTLKQRGYVQVAGGVEPRSDELEAAILADPDAAEPRLVYGDWLQTRGHPRGELCALQHALEASPSNRRFAARCRTLLGDDAVFPAPLRTAASLPETVPGGACRFVWRGGFVHAAVVGRASKGGTHGLSELVVDLLGHPCARLLHRLTVGAQRGKGGDYREIVEAITRWRPPALRSLHLAQMSPSVLPMRVVQLGSVDAMLSALPRLRRLHLSAGQVELTRLCLPELTELTLASPRLAAVVSGLQLADVPSLQHLHLDACFGVLDEACFSLVHRLGATRLTLSRTVNTARVVRLLAQSGAAGRLTDLSMPAGDLNGEGTAVADLTGGVFGRLQRLDVSHNALPEAALAVLGAGDVKLEAADQRVIATYGPAWLHQFARGGGPFEAAAALAEPEHWQPLHRDAGLRWGRCRGKTSYDVGVDPDLGVSTCTCKSRSRPCKHVLALAMLGWKVAIERQAAPSELRSRLAPDRYDGIHE